MFSRVFMLLSEFHLGILQYCCSYDSVDEEECGFLQGCQQQVVFETLRQRLYEAPILNLIEGVEDFVVSYDASIIDLGAVLMQRGRVIVYASKKLKPHEIRCLTHKLELGKVVFVLKIWKHYLWGSGVPSTWITRA